MSKRSQTKNKKIRNNILPWIFSFIAAFGLWLYVSSVENPSNEAEFNEIPITFTENDNGLSIISNSNPTVNVTVHGKKSVISNMSTASFSAVADITEIETTGTHSVRVTVTTPENVTITDKSIEKLEVFLDVKGTKEIDVFAKPLNCIPSEGYVIYDDMIETSVKKITISGPLSELDKIDYASVLIPFDENQLVKRSITAENMEIDLIDVDGNTVSSPYISLDISYVNVKIPVFLSKTIKTVAEFSDTDFDPSSAVVSVTPTTLRIEGVVEDIQDLEEYVVTVDEPITVPTTITKEITESDFKVTGSDKTVTIKITEKTS